MPGKSRLAAGKGKKINPRAKFLPAFNLLSDVHVLTNGQLPALSYLLFPLRPGNTQLLFILGTAPDPTFSLKSVGKLHDLPSPVTT